MTKLHCIVNLNVEGEVICFCSYEEYTQGRCACRDQYDCPEALIEVEVLPNTKPSEQAVIKLRNSSKEMEQALRGAEAGAKKIKEGLSRLEQTLTKSRFRL